MLETFDTTKLIEQYTEFTSLSVVASSATRYYLTLSFGEIVSWKIVSWKTVILGGVRILGLGHEAPGRGSSAGERSWRDNPHDEELMLYTQSLING